MSDDQLSALLVKIKGDSSLQEKLRASGSLDSAVALANAEGFSVSKEDWLAYQANHAQELSDAELESVSGGDSYWCATAECGPIM